MAGPCFWCFLWGVWSYNSLDVWEGPLDTVRRIGYGLGIFGGPLKHRAQAGWSRGLAASRDCSPLLSPCHTWSALADLGFPLCAECLRARICQERTSLAYLTAALWLSLVTASGMSLPGGWSSRCLGSNTAELTLGHICPKNGLAELAISMCLPCFYPLCHMVPAQGFILRFWKSPQRGMNFNGEHAPWPSILAWGVTDPFQTQTAPLLHRSHQEAKRWSQGRRQFLKPKKIKF